MRESIVEVLVYLLEVAFKHINVDQDPVNNQLTIRRSLENAGFSKDLVTEAFDWLRDLIEQQSWYADTEAPETFNNKTATFRIFSQEEHARLSTQVKNFIISLEQARIIDTKMREIIIGQLMQLNHRLVDLDEAKLVVMLVLVSKLNHNVYDIRNYLAAANLGK